MFKSNKLSGVWVQFHFFFYWNIIQSEMQMFLMLPKAKHLEISIHLTFYLMICKTIVIISEGKKVKV